MKTGAEMAQEYALVSDTGGTNTRVALVQGGVLLRDTIVRYQNAEFTGLDLILRDYLARHPAPITALCSDIAGVVIDGKGHVNKPGWDISESQLAALSGASYARMFNDMQAHAYAAWEMSGDQLTEILPGQMRPGPKLVVNVGTGLNAVLTLHENGLTYSPPSEAGMIGLSARSEEELRLFHWISARHPEPVIEELLSGRGVEAIHQWICHDEGSGTPLAAPDILAAYHAGDAQARRCLQIFTRYLGRYTADMAQATLPYAGIQLVGGVMHHLCDLLADAGFADAMPQGGRPQELIAGIPVHVVTDDYSALKGCAAHLRQATQTNQI